MMISEKQVIDFLKSKDRSYIDNLISLLDNHPDNHDLSDLVCPICGSIHIKKNGKDSNGHQRYLCKDCHRTFNDRTCTLFSWTHLTMEQWLLFIDLEISEMKLEDEAHFLGVSMTTCFYMRHKLYHAATEIINKQILSGEIEVDTQYLSINLKGTKPQNMPRYSKKRGGQSAFRGISHHKISVICAVDEEDQMIMNITGLGSESFEKYKSNERYFGDVKELISDSKSCIQQFANHLGTTNNKVPTTPIVKKYLTKDGKSLGVINEMMTEVAGLITKTKGIGTRYLQGYLNFNILRKRMKYKYKRDKVPEEIMDLLVETSSFKNIFVCSSPMPISLKEAYYEYRYGIFKD